MKIDLSVLIPAYRYPAGVSRILAGLYPWANRAEVLISDDSPDDSVAAAVEDFRQRHAVGNTLRLVHNRPALGAVPNWNALLDAARGTHCWLLHHDEFPIGANFTARLLARLDRADAPDVLLLDCLLTDPNSGRNRRHLPLATRVAVLRHAPGYLLRRNAVGPVSSMVMRRTQTPRFDPALKWLVDVDFYLRLMRQPGLRLAPAHGLAIGSILGRAASITNQLGSETLRLEREERAHLQKRGGADSAWLVHDQAQNAVSRLVLPLEQAAWGVLRVSQRLPWMLGRSALPEATMRAALAAGAGASP